ncbi:MAG: C39 family peptidase [Candidatus Saccharimonadales bacterium]
MKYIGPDEDVPFFSQFDSNISETWQNKYCGIVSLYMVMSYFWQQNNKKDAPSLNEVSLAGLESGSYKADVGWEHTGLANLARDYGFRAVVRSWFIRSGDLEIMNNQGRLSNSKEEKFYVGMVQDEFLHTLYNLLADKLPLIISVKPNFGSNGSDHLIVITAINDDLSMVKVHDPQEELSAANQEIKVSYLLKYCNFNGIIVK